MNCKLCETPIKNYDPKINLLKINKNTTANICPECIEKFTKWQQEFLAKLFPTKAAKKYLEKNKTP